MSRKNQLIYDKQNSLTWLAAVVRGQRIVVGAVLAVLDALWARGEILLVGATGWQAIPFWNCVGLFIVVGIVKGTVVPTVASVSQSNTNK